MQQHAQQVQQQQQAQAAQQAQTLAALNKLISSSVAGSLGIQSLSGIKLEGASNTSVGSTAPAVQQSPIATATTVPAITSLVASTATSSPAAVAPQQPATAIPVTLATVGTPLPAATGGAQPVVSLAGVKPLTQIPIQFISPAAAAHMATISQLINQQQPQAAVNNNTAAAAVNPPASAAATAAPSASPSAVNPAVVSATPITPIPTINMSPMISPVILPSSVLTQANLNQAQLTPVSGGNLVSSQLLKSLGQIPILQQPLTIAQGGVMKPVMVVTMPSVVTTTTAPGTSIAAGSLPPVATPTGVQMTAATPAVQVQQIPEARST